MFAFTVSLHVRNTGRDSFRVAEPVSRRTATDGGALIPGKRSNRPPHEEDGISLIRQSCGWPVLVLMVSSSTVQVSIFSTDWKKNFRVTFCVFSLAFYRDGGGI